MSGRETTRPGYHTQRAFITFVRRPEMFKNIKHRIARLSLVISIALIASGVPLVEIAQAAECAGCSGTPG